MEKDPVCLGCKHLEDKDFGTCKAFPKGIPVGIWNGENDHHTEFSGDGGTRYGPLPGRRP